MVAGALVLAGLTWTLPAQDTGGTKQDSTKSGKSDGSGGGKAERRRGGGENGPGGRGNFDPEQMRQRFMQGYKDALGATDDEWKVLQPKLEKVMSAQRDARSGGMGFPGGFGGRGGPGGGPGGAPGGGPGGQGGPGGGGQGGNRGADTANQTPVAKATADLRTTIDNKSASSEEIGKKLTALREAREKAKADLVAAQKDLKELLTQRQEATLVMMGMLE